MIGMGSKLRLRVLLADDHQMLTDALKGVLEPRFEVVGSVRDGRALVDALSSLRPDVVVVDVAMPQLNGLDAARQLRRAMPKLKIVIMTTNEDPDVVGEAFRAGASAFVLKQAAAFEVADAIEKVLKGGSYVTPSAAKGQREISLRDPKAREHTAEPTQRQREVIRLLAKTNAEECSIGVSFPERVSLPNCKSSSPRTEHSGSSAREAAGQLQMSGDDTDDSRIQDRHYYQYLDMP
jgi:DNA-binding NarL/FixJ family response regulator